VLRIGKYGNSGIVHLSRVPGERPVQQYIPTSPNMVTVRMCRS
jgi:hypothetical protein